MAEPYVRFDQFTPERWNELISEAYKEGKVQLRVLEMKETSTVLKQKAILVEQLRAKKGGQIVEFDLCGEKMLKFVIC